MAIAASPTASAMPQLATTDLSGLIASLQQATAQLSTILQSLQAQLGTGAAAGASTLAGGPGQSPNQLPGQSPMSGCGCHGGAGAAAGAAQVGQAPAGAAGAPDAAPAKASKQTTGGGAKGAPQAMKSDRAAPTQGGGGTKGQQMVEEARKYLGTPYLWAGASPKGFDCSGLMLYIAKKFGIDLPHKASEQAKQGTAVDKADLQPGDLVFFKTDGSGSISHVGMYIGNGQMIHAPKTGDVVKVSSINDSYYSSRWAGARRIG